MDPREGHAGVYTEEVRLCNSEEAGADCDVFSCCKLTGNVIFAKLIWILFRMLSWRMARGGVDRVDGRAIPIAQESSNRFAHIVSFHICFTDAGCKICHVAAQRFNAKISAGINR